MASGGPASVLRLASLISHSLGLRFFMPAPGLSAGALNVFFETFNEALGNEAAGIVAEKVAALVNVRQTLLVPAG